MNAAEIRERSKEELNLQLSELEDKVFKLRFQRATGQLNDVSKIRIVRKEIARIKTVLTERDREVGS